MKTFTLITIIVISLLPIQMYSQSNDKSELRPENISLTRIIPHSFQDEKSGHPSESDIDKESRTIINITVPDNGFLLIEELQLNWDGSNWMNYWKIAYSPLGNIALEQSWDGSNWVNEFKYNYTYDVNDNVIERVKQDWDGSNWVNDEMYTYSYDANNNMIEWLWQNWVSSNWVNYQKSTYAYNVNNNMIETLIQNWYLANWVDYLKYTNTYDVNNNLIERLVQGWDGDNWEIWNKTTYTYDVNNNMIEALLQIWDGSNWFDGNKNTYTYDVNDNMIEQLRQMWQVFHWVNIWKRTYTYDVNNNMIEALQQIWDDSNWFNNWKRIYSYIPTGIEQFNDKVKTYILSNNYPNPFNPSTKINYQIPHQEFVTLKVYDVLGNEVATFVNQEKQAGSYEVDFNATNLSSGIYFYRLQAGSFVETKKMVLMK